MHENSKADAGEANWDAARPVLDAAMQQLGERDRAALLARFFENKSFGEIGTRLAASEDAARMRVERALEKLRGLLARRGVTSTAAALGGLLASEAAAAAPPGLAASVAGGALAGASVATASTWAVLQFMSTTKFIGAAAGFALLLAVGVAVHEWRANRLAGDVRRDAARATLALEARARALERKAQEAEGRAAEREREAVAPNSAGTASAPPPSDPVANGRNFLAQHPEAVGLVLDYQRIATTRAYQGLFHALALTPDQIEQFLAIVVRANAGVRWNTPAQAPIAEFEVGENPTAEERERQLRAVLGDANYGRYRDFERSRGARSLVEQVARSARFADEPFGAAQADGLEGILRRHSPDFAAGRNFSSANLDWEAVLAEARETLSPRQWQELAGVREQGQFSSALSRAANDAMAEAKRAAGIP